MPEPGQNPPTVDWALEQFETQKFGEDVETFIVVATLMENCDTEPRITWKHGYRFLDLGGLFAEFGARILYVKTGRDDTSFSFSKPNWRKFLLENGYTIDT